ncbi:MAG: DUF29 domain-containing protein [Gomphosphaeria aponina SAG 52.96 = DSM 107014]|uniref:DUF29 domain-containing protein n=1 Tax=Gomphosphaeria aponina SAG 52.96 = DSM 107014 TaxID=1521640 RepID=A0A941GWY7_9CHRO|nr:DUF29 domain-containing protein [Gomphosphaeria aponina SAG 52.96 = DSM 107014]
MTKTAITHSLYERDFNLWLHETIEQLKAGKIENIDIENLIEELDSLARRDRRELKSRLRVLITHLLKRRYVVDSDYYRGWELTIKEQGQELKSLLQQSPSLKNYLLEIFPEVCSDALLECRDAYLYAQFPTHCPYNIDALFSEDFWQEQNL